MKPIKMFGLAALAALMAMAFVGASSAMAEDTILCSNDSAESCTAVTHIHETSTTKAKLLTTFLTIECDVLFLGDTLEVRTGSSAQVINGTFTYTNCGSCTVTEENGPAEIKVLKLGHETADVTGEGLVHAVCGKSLDCSYNGTGLLGTAKGPLLSTQKNGEVTLAGQTTNKEAGGFLCPATSKLDITTTPLIATYIGKALHYCVKYQHNTNGNYEGSCKKVVANAPEELVIGPAGFAVNELVCVHLIEETGLWEEFNDETGLCEEDSAKLNDSLYELATILLVE